MVTSLFLLRRYSEVADVTDVITVSVCPEYQLDLEFKNGERRRFDMRPLLLMKPWNRIASPVLFELAHINYGTVVWPGEIDVAPETLYDDSVPLCFGTPSPRDFENIK